MPNGLRKVGGTCMDYLSGSTFPLLTPLCDLGGCNGSQLMHIRIIRAQTLPLPPLSR